MVDPSRWSDERIEVIISVLLRIGVGAAAALVAVGGLLLLLRHGGEQPLYSVFRGEPSELRGLRGIIATAGDLRGRGLIQLGLVVLLATPVARVAFSAIAFARQRDLFYVGVTLTVLAVLVYSIALA
jgi:uncharacterized membrane protein